MDEPLTGRLLVASPLLLDPNFHRSVVLVLEHGEDGAVGVVLNRPSRSPLAEHLPAWAPRAVPPRVVFVGGPVEPSVAIGLELAESPSKPTAVPALGLLDLEGDPGGDSRVRIFSGYSGWSGGQLEAELEEGAWMVVEADAADAVDREPAELWSRVLRRQEGPLRLLSTYPPDPSLN